MNVLPMIFTALLLFVASNGFCIEGTNTNDRNHPFVKHLEAQYLKFYEAGQTGDKEAWIAIRDAQIAAKVKPRLEKITSEKLKSASKANTDLRECEFIQVETVGHIARMTHKKISRDSADATVNIQVNMFHKEGEEWKLGDGASISSESLEKCLEMSSDNPRLQLLDKSNSEVGAETEKEEKVVFPTAPTDGTPAVVEFLSMTGSGHYLAGKFRVYSFADKDIKKIGLNLKYLDATGKELKDFPHSHIGMPHLVSPRSYKDFKGGSFIPKETVKIDVELLNVIYTDDDVWEKKTL